MNVSNLSTNSAGAGLLAAVVASLCCITPVFSLLAGIGGIAATFSWMEPFRPYLIVLTLGVLGFAWYVKLKPRSQDEMDCACEDDEKPSFWQSRRFLTIVTVGSALMLSFPSYSHIFYSNPNNSNFALMDEQDSTRQVTINVKGMTCSGCEAHIENAVAQLQGVKMVDASFASGTAVVEFLTKDLDEDQIAKAINKTGYEVVDKDVNKSKTSSSEKN